MDALKNFLTGFVLNGMVLFPLGFTVSVVIILLPYKIARQINYSKYSEETVALLDTIEYKRSTYILSFHYKDQEGKDQLMKISTNNALPRGAPCPVKFSANKPQKAVVDYTREVSWNSLNIRFKKTFLIHYDILVRTKK